MRKRPLANLNNILLDRLLRTGLHNICFTERQKLSLLHVAGTISPSTQQLFHQSMLELNLVAVGMTSDPPAVLSPQALSVSASISIHLSTYSPFCYPPRFYRCYSLSPALTLITGNRPSSQSFPNSSPSANNLAGPCVSTRMRRWPLLRGDGNGSRHRGS
jgi:hypothetical protein